MHGDECSFQDCSAWVYSVIGEVRQSVWRDETDILETCLHQVFDVFQGIL